MTSSRRTATPEPAALKMHADQAEQKLNAIIADLNVLENYAIKHHMYKTRQRIKKLIFEAIAAHTDLYGI